MNDEAARRQRAQARREMHEIETALAAFAQDNGWRISSRSGRTLHPLVGTADGTWRGRHYLDHGVAFTRDRRVVAIVGAPYDLTPEDLNEMREDAERFNLDIRVRRNGWYPSAVHVFVQRKEDR